MGMSKEELKEMIDNVIVSNGKGQITADVLNLVLNNIVENAGGGGGGVKILFLNEYMIEDIGSEFFEPFFNHNANIYNTIIEKYMSLMQCNQDNADEMLSNMVDIFNDSFFKVYDIYEEYSPTEFFSAYSIDVLFHNVEEDSESNELIVRFLDKHDYYMYDLYSNGECKPIGREE